MSAPPHPDVIPAEMCIGISGLKKNPSAVIAAARDGQVAILNRNKPVAYVISPEAWEYLCDMQEDIRDAELVRDRLAQETETIPVAVDDL
jgi:antitoxin StbD